MEATFYDKNRNGYAVQTMLLRVTPLKLLQQMGYDIIQYVHEQSVRQDWWMTELCPGIIANPCNEASSLLELRLWSVETKFVFIA